MQAIANWLVARPQNAVIGLAVTLPLPLQLVGGIVIALVVLAHGWRQAMLEAAIAAVLVVAIFLLSGQTVTTAVGMLALTWLPVMALVAVLVATRSLTMLMQLSVIAAVMGLLGFALIVADPDVFWQPYLQLLQEIFKERGLQIDASVMNADVMTMSAVLAFWLLYSSCLLLGYALYRGLPRDTAEFGRFRDLRYGQMIAVATALAWLLSYIVESSVLQNIASVLLVAFLMQGLALLHWLRHAEFLPVITVIAVYVLLPLLQVLPVMLLAIVGYTDAWIDFRRRFEKKKGPGT